MIIQLQNPQARGCQSQRSLHTAVIQLGGWETKVKLIIWKML